MSLAAHHARLRQLGRPYFTSREASAWLGLDANPTATILARLVGLGQVVKLARGRWAEPDRFDPMMLPQALTHPRVAYVSLYSALAHYGLIEQIPEVVYGVTVLRASRVVTPIGSVSLHQVAPSFCFGFELERDGVYLATPEKALADVLYLTPARSSLFRALPELTLPRSFRAEVVSRHLERIDAPGRRALARRRFEALV